MGPLARYAVNVASTTDVQKVLYLTDKQNIRLAIRNTGYDFMGKSPGPAAVAFWTHHLKLVQSMPGYIRYSGPTMRIGAGIQGSKAQNAAHKSGFVIVTGHYPDIRIAGGYTQGGGHGPLGSRYRRQLTNSWSGRL
ncbi:unnamed protein product [Aspergillus oryzae RIB40]|uniref:DNA, SC010 n=1 Tax=Aspergillus oryzae (strain ATCC 42149 / RIB 40) TaxID=510516 RepID=Q2TXG8_ASPOR|nr:unnamed protein product [Aspergillus oryzae RIB40]BAE66055.1 unnamed protein product [Aspergillus oryzae RIB40]